MERDHRNREKNTHRFGSEGFRQSHGGRDRFPGSEWGSSGEFGHNSEFHDLDRRDDRWSRPYDMDNFETGRQFSDREMYHNGDKGYIGKGPKGYRRSDERIREEACEALFHSPSVDASDIDVDVKEGHVTLSGTVDSRYAKREAESSVEHLTGVIDVHNQLRLKTNSGSELQNH